MPSSLTEYFLVFHQMSALGGGLTAISQSQWDSTSLSKFEKNFYQEHPAVSALTSTDVEAFRASKQVLPFHHLHSHTSPHLHRQTEPTRQYGAP